MIACWFLAPPHQTQGQTTRLRLQEETAEERLERLKFLLENDRSSDEEMIQAEEKLEESKKLAEISMYNVLSNDVGQF